VLPASAAELLLGPQLLRNEAITAILPAYPKIAGPATHEGRAVAELLISEKGEVTEIQVLEAPDEATSKSVSDALKRWRFRPATGYGSDTAFVVKGRLIFYFKMVNGTPTVLDAADIESRKRAAAKQAAKLAKKGGQ
jgi:TonB family protein